MRFHDLPDGVRPARPRDYDAIAAVVDSWWGRPILDSLPRLFLDHFHDTSLVVERRAAGTTDLRGFLIGFASPTQPLEAYIHFSASRRPSGAAGWAGASTNSSSPPHGRRDAPPSVRSPRR